jgi:hypothetical protein
LVSYFLSYLEEKLSVLVKRLCRVLFFSFFLFSFLFPNIITSCSTPAAVILASLSVLVIGRAYIAARRRHYNNQRLRAAAALQRGTSISFPGAQDSDEEDGGDNDLEHGTGIPRGPTRGLAAHQQSGSPALPPKLPAIVLHPDLSTVEFAIKEEHSNNDTTTAAEGQVNQQGARPSTTTPIPASSATASRRTPAPAAAMFLFDGRGGGFRRSNTGQLRRQQRGRRSALPPALVTIEIDGSCPEEEEEKDDEREGEDHDDDEICLENAEETPVVSAAPS